MTSSSITGTARATKSSPMISIGVGSAFAGLSPRLLLFLLLLFLVLLLLFTSTAMLLVDSFLLRQLSSMLLLVRPSPYKNPFGQEEVFRFPSPLPPCQFFLEADALARASPILCFSSFAWDELAPQF